ncbi:hypothetical protein FPANT_865 [Fusarium pseudoanthophilum]|uniref:Protein kinase domain-containing protein n=1 Tax=Fusarium pseudoanthophilum TaxID=48495 RepID=A0A8H5Q2L4_9HYPO|nr:hypothetical protein FPANT_865 [Fusarium pseudoanthophilum]
MPTCNDECTCPETGAKTGNDNRRRRPATFARTGRRRVVAEPSNSTSTLIGSASERHTNIRHEKGPDAVATLNRLLKTLEESGIPGPQLFRLDTEFSHGLGQGGQGNVRGLDENVARRYRMADKRIQKVWPAKMIAIKQHIERKDSKATTARFNSQDLASRFRAAECEVLALSPSILRNHPNIVKLVGWGLCLDTLENPSSRCCRGLQLPLLVFERAEMDFANFLGGLFPEPLRSDASRLEEGLAWPPEDSSLPPSRLWLPPRIHQYWKSLKWILGAELDPYEVVRLLCIDVGHGLQCLHENGFSHGDLKPNNVLVFNAGQRWLAKLCDFGCAVGQVTTGKVEYFGTPFWLPEASEIEALDSRHRLQQCDLYVYGLLVWSAFCLRGQHPPANPKLHNALDDLNQLCRLKRHRWLLPTTNRKKLFAKIGRLLGGTLVDRSRRDVEPWTWLYHEHGTRKDVPYDSAVVENNRNSYTDQLARSFKAYKPHITLEMKARYDKLSWWQRDNDGIMDIILPGEHYHVAEATRDTYIGSRPGPASSEALSLEENSLETTLFVSQRSRAVAVPFRLRMIKHLKESKKPSIRRTAYVLPSRSSQQKAISKYQEWYETLYHMARFRSRISLEWWDSALNEGHIDLLGHTNIIKMALAVSPPVDINTLAWLCAGPVGKAEVKRLKPKFSIWKTMLASSDLDESARLDRFLLLLQFGARVEQRVLGRRGPLQDFNIESQWDSGTIFSLYIRSCRPATIPAVIREIANRLYDSRGRGFVSDGTLRYLIGTRTLTDDLETAEAEIDCMKDQNFTAVKALRHYMFPIGYLTPYPGVGIPDIGALISGGPVAGSSLPHGWKRISVKRGGQSLECFEDGFTQSITLEPPKVSLVKQRQVQIGLLQDHPSLSCHLDLLSCMRAGAGQERRQKFEADLRSRFPDYDEAWYMSEWNTEPNTKDLLGELKEPWRIQTFTAFLETPGLKDKVRWFLVHVSGVLGSTVVVVAMSCLLTSMTLAMWITFHWFAVGMILWLVWVLMWLVWVGQN